MKIFSVFALLLILSMNLAAQVPLDGLIAYYPFNGNADDQSGNGNNGVVIGATLTTDRKGESVSAYSFDGVNDGISVSGFNINPNAFTISLWFMARTDGDANGKKLFLRSNPSDKTDWCWNISWYKKNGPSKVYSGVKTTNGSVTDSADSSPKNNWNNVVMTWDGSTKKVYINGVLKRTKFMENAFVNYENKSGVYIGFDSESGFFNGKIDDIRVYNRVLNLNEINELNNEGETYSLKLLSPAGGEDFVAGANHEIKWSGIGIQSVKIEYSVDSGATWLNLVNFFNNTGTYIWTTPNITSQNCLIRISNSENLSMNSISSSVFSIEQFKIKILSPDGDETCGVGTTYPILWNSNNVQSVNLDYSTDNGATWTSIASGYPSSGVFNWEVPPAVSSQALMKITNAETESIYDISTNNFIIRLVTDIKDSYSLPHLFSVDQNYPNPFNPSTKISFSISQSAFVELVVFDVLGREINKLISNNLDEGNYNINFNAAGLPSGTYFYKLTAGSETLVKKMQLLK